MKKFTLLLLAALMVMIPVAQGQGDPAIAGAEWLLSKQNEDGSWGSEGGVDNISPTTLALIALGSVDQLNEAGMAWLEKTVSESLEDVGNAEMANVVIAVRAQGGDPTAFAGVDLVAGLIQEPGESVDQLCLTLSAGASGGEVNPTLLEALLASQNADGSFQDNPDDDSSKLLTTALCGDALAYAGESEALAKVLEYLKSAQNEDGGWSIFESAESDAFATEFVLFTLLSADENLTEWNNPERLLYSLQDQETGATPAHPEFADDTEFTVVSTALATMIFRGKTFTSFAPEATEVETTAADPGEMPEGPALDAAQWAPVMGGFGMTELDTADDFFVTVVDPFTDDELYGVEILNWVADYQYTGYIIEQYLPADILIWMAEQDSTVWENVSPSLLSKLPAEELAKLPEEVQARASE